MLVPKLLRDISSIHLLALVFSACQPRTQDLKDWPTQIVQEISKRKIVMLGDFSHESPLPFQNVTTVLSAWLASLEKGEFQDSHLTLFLEDDRVVVGLVKEYLKGGDLNPFLDFVLPSTTLERLEFYSDLRSIALRIDSLNRVSLPAKQILFDVQGPEEMNVFDERILDSSDRAATKYFVVERDSLSANNIITYFDQYPDRKALVFYGLLHLIKTVTIKDNSGELSSEESTGKFLANYLKGKYGDGQVFTINQLARGSYPASSESNRTNQIIQSEDIPWKDAPLDNPILLPQNFDSFIFRDEFVVPGHPLREVFSNRIIRASIKRLERLAAHRSSAFGKRFYDQATSTLSFLSDTVLPGAKEWKRWYNTSRAGIFEHLQSVTYQNKVAKEYFLKRQDPEAINRLIGLGFDIRIRNTQITWENWDRMFKEEWPQILFLNAVGVYWVGDQSEKEGAKKYLIAVSGKNYDAPDKYLKLWRAQFFHVSY